MFDTRYLHRLSGSAVLADLPQFHDEEGLLQSLKMIFIQIVEIKHK